MPISTNVTNLKINELTEAQYDTAVQQGVIGANEISIITDAGGGDFVPQLDTMPTADATNVGEIVQYSGTTDANYTNGYFYESAESYSDPSATISQTTGSGLTGLAVNVDTFVATEQPTQSESVVFTASVVPAGTTYTPVTGTTTLSGGNIRQIFIDRGYDWDTYHEFWNAFIVFTDPDYCYFSNAIGGDTVWFYATTPDLVAYGFTIIGTPTAGDIIQYSYTDGSFSWTKGGETVNPADYGVSYSGTPNNGDALTVVYTAPAITGYLWERKDVQPAPDVGIEWKTSVDLPGNFQEGSWGISPVFKINGGLPDGIYEFYYQMKVSSWFSSSTNLLPATVTFKYLVKINNTENTYGTINGMISPVINGEWGGNTSKRLPQDRDYIYTFGYKDGSGNLYLRADSGWWNTDLHGYANPCPDVSDCFRLSAIKNITTGDTYIAEGSLYNNVQPGDIQMSCQLDIDAIQSSPFVPSSMTFGAISIADLPSTQTLACGGIRFENGQWAYSTELTVSLRCGGDKFDARFQAFVDEYIITIDEATGIFASTEFVRTASSLYVKLNLPVGTSGVIQAQYAMKDMTTNMGCNFYVEDITGQSTTQLIPLKIGVTPSIANYIGRILQYTGTTDANYTNGYFYKATGNVVSVPGSVTCEEVSSYSKTISLDVDGFINFMTTLGYYKGTIEDWLNNYGEFTYDVDGNTLNWSWFGTFPDTATALQYFTFSPAAASGERIIWRTYNYVAAHTEVQNAAWTQAQTQPGATTPSTMPTLLAANWSSNTQTVSVQGVTASNNVIVSPAPASAADYASAGIVCTAQGSGTLTFTCTSVPTNDITVNVAIL